MVRSCRVARTSPEPRHLRFRIYRQIPRAQANHRAMTMTELFLVMRRHLYRRFHKTVLLPGHGPRARGLPKLQLDARVEHLARPKVARFCEQRTRNPATE